MTSFCQFKSTVLVLGWEKQITEDKEAALNIFIEAVLAKSDLSVIEV